MGTGRNWTRRSIEELVDEYLKTHGGGGGGGSTPEAVNAKLATPTSLLFQHIRGGRIPENKCRGIAPSNYYDMCRLQFWMVNSQGELEGNARTYMIEHYNLFDIKVVDNVDYNLESAGVMPYRFTINRNEYGAPVELSVNTGNGQMFNGVALILNTNTRKGVLITIDTVTGPLFYTGLKVFNDAEGREYSLLTNELNLQEGWNMITAMRAKMTEIEAVVGDAYAKRVHFVLPDSGTPRPTIDELHDILYPENFPGWSGDWRDFDITTISI